MLRSPSLISDPAAVLAQPREKKPARRADALPSRAVGQAHGAMLEWVAAKMESSFAG